MKIDSYKQYQFNLVQRGHIKNVSTNPVSKENNNLADYNTSIAYKNQVVYQPAFKSTEKSPDIVYKKLSDEEFEEKLAKVENALKKREISNRNLNINKINIFILEKILSDEKLYSNKSILLTLKTMLHPHHTREDNIEYKLDLLNNYTSNENFYNNNEVKQEIGYLLKFCDQGTVPLLEKILSHPLLYQNDGINTNLNQICRWENQKEHAVECKKTLMDKFVNDEKLHNNKIISEYIGEITAITREPEQLKARLKFLEEFANDENMQKNKELKNNFLTVIINTNTTNDVNRKLELLEKYLGNYSILKKCDNKNKLLALILTTTTNDDLVIKFLDKLLTNKNLTKNKLYLSEMLEMIKECKDENDNPNVYNTKLINLFLTNEKLYNNESILEEINFCLQKTKKANLDPKILNTLIDKYLNDEKIAKHKNVTKNFGIILGHIYGKNQEDILNMVSDEKMLAWLDKNISSDKKIDFALLMEFAKTQEKTLLL